MPWQGQILSCGALTSRWVFHEALALLISWRQVHKPPSERQTVRKGWAGTEEVWKNTDEDLERNKKVTTAEILAIRKPTADEEQD